MRLRGLLLLALLVGISSTLMGDQINFNFTTGPSDSVIATKSGGLASGPSDLISISDSTSGTIIPFSGTYVRGNTGPATSFLIGSLVVASFAAGGTSSVFAIDSGAVTLVEGNMRDGASLLSTFPAGTGSFLGTFDVTFVNPAALALFGLPATFEPVGSVAFTFANADVAGGVLTAAIGGGAVTVQTLPAAPVPEVATLLMLGTGLCFLGFFRKSWPASPKQVRRCVSLNEHSALL